MRKKKTQVNGVLIAFIMLVVVGILAVSTIIIAYDGDISPNAVFEGDCIECNIEAPEVSVSDKELGGTGPTHYFKQEFLGGTMYNNTYSSSTLATTMTLRTSDLQDYDTWFITPNTGNLVYTFPASSTMSSFLPNAGDRKDLWVYNASTTSGVSISFVAGTGWDLETASSTYLDFVINSDDWGRMTLVRQPRTATTSDFSVLMDKYDDMD